jgi:putative hydrolase of the HAD superfamily
VSRTRAVFFDAGHTLLYAHPDLGTVYAETTAALGVRLEPSAFVEAFQPAFRDCAPPGAEASDEQDRAMWREITRRIYGRLPALAPIAFEAWFEALWRRFGEADAWRLYDDVESALGGLRARGLRLGVVSNWDTRLRGIAEGLGLARLVDFVVISAEAGVRKPDRRIFEAALARAGVAPEEALHVGDLPEEDAEGARRAGIRPVLIERRKRMLEVAAGPGVSVVRGLDELDALL